MRRTRGLLDAKHTLYACGLAIGSQAVVNNFVPLLLITFEGEFGLSLSDIAVLVGFNFFVQLVTDFVAAFVVDRVGYRPAIVFGQVCAALGLLGLAVLPAVMTPFAGLMVAVAVYAVGGGLCEVLVSPIVEHSPTEKKAAAMSLMHSFYCWGHVFVVLASALFFLAFGIRHWRVLAVIWALLPLADAWYFTRVPITQPPAQQGMRGAVNTLRQPAFWFLFVLMVCSGAAEQSVSQWASAFAESGLKVPKAVGDLAGPAFFATMMGLSRVLHARYAERFSLPRVMVISGLMCLTGYLMLVLSPTPVLALLGVGLVGFSVGVFWPGTLSLAAVRLPLGGTVMYGILALAGDVGCSVGPSMVGFVSDLAGGSLNWGFALAALFPLVLVGLIVYSLTRARRPRPLQGGTA